MLNVCLQAVHSVRQEVVFMMDEEKKDFVSHVVVVRLHSPVVCYSEPAIHRGNKDSCGNEN